MYLTNRLCSRTGKCLFIVGGGGGGGGVNLKDQIKFNIVNGGENQKFYF